MCAAQIRRARQPTNQPRMVGRRQPRDNRPRALDRAARATADRQGHAVDDDHVPARAALPGRVTERRPGQGAELARYARCPLVMVLNTVRGDDGDDEHVRIRHARPHVAPMPALLHRVPTRRQRCAHPFGIHRLLRCNSLFFSHNHAETTDERQRGIKVSYGYNVFARPSSPSLHNGWLFFGAVVGVIVCCDSRDRVYHSVVVILVRLLRATCPLERAPQQTCPSQFGMVIEVLRSRSRDQP